MSGPRKNSITDLPGVRVSHLTGLTAVFPYPPEKKIRLFAAASVLGGKGELTGYEVLDDFCYLNSPVVITDFLNVGRAYNAVLTFGFSAGRDELWPPVVIGVDDSYLHAGRDFVIEEKEILEALGKTTAAEVGEGSVGVGHALCAFRWKGGVGTASRGIEVGGRSFTCGVLVATNLAPGTSFREEKAAPDLEDRPQGSLTIIAGSDLPLLPHQMQQVAASILAGLAGLRPAANKSDVLTCLFFSTANAMSMEDEGPPVFDLQAVDDSWLSAISTEFEKAAWEAVGHSLLQAKPVRGREGREPATIQAGDWEKILKERGRS